MIPIVPFVFDHLLSLYHVIKCYGFNFTQVLFLLNICGSVEYVCVSSFACIYVH